MKGKKREDDFSDVKPKGMEHIPTELEKIKNGQSQFKMEKVSMYGIVETKDVVVFLTKTANACVEAVKDDGKITIGDVFKFGGAATALFPALSGISQVPKELADLDADEKNELIDLVKAELELESDVEQVIEKALQIAGQIKELIDLVAQLKAA